MFGYKMQVRQLEQFSQTQDEVGCKDVPGLEARLPQDLSASDS